MPTPSPQPVPSAACANDLHRPSEASPPCLLNSANAVGVAITVTPPASASVHSPVRRARIAKWIATRDDEHAVSTVTAGPSNPSEYEIRPDITALAVPVSPYPSAPAASSGAALP